MSKKPNEKGRIEAEPKEGRMQKAKRFTGKALYVALPLVLVALGVAGTLKYQSFINETKAQGVAEYQLNKCDMFTDEKKNTTWLECDE